MIEPVTDKQTAEFLERHLKAMLEGRDHVRKDWWSVSGRAAVAIESGMHFVESQAEAISAALNEAGKRLSSPSSSRKAKRTDGGSSIQPRSISSS